MEFRPIDPQPDELTQQFSALLDWAEATLTQAQLDLLYGWLDTVFEHGPDSPACEARWQEITHLLEAAGGSEHFQFLN